MSSGGSIRFVIWSIELLCRTISELKLTYEEKKAMTTEDGKIHKVDVLVKDEFDKDIGFEKQKDGTYRIIADSRGLTFQQKQKQKKYINMIKRRYAYNMVTQELKKQGYQIVEEKKLEKDTVKVTARRWEG